MVHLQVNITDQTFFSSHSSSMHQWVKDRLIQPKVKGTDHPLVSSNSSLRVVAGLPANFPHPAATFSSKLQTWPKQFAFPKILVAQKSWKMPNHTNISQPNYWAAIVSKQFVQICKITNHKTNSSQNWRAYLRLPAVTCGQLVPRPSIRCVQFYTSGSKNLLISKMDSLPVVVIDLCFSFCCLSNKVWTFVTGVAKIIPPASNTYITVPWIIGSCVFLCDLLIKPQGRLKVTRPRPWFLLFTGFVIWTDPSKNSPPACDPVSSRLRSWRGCGSFFFYRKQPLCFCNIISRDKGAWKILNRLQTEKETKRKTKKNFVKQLKFPKWRS